MTTLKGIYDNGQIRLLEKAPLKKEAKVLITFIEEEDEEDNVRGFALNNSSEELREYLNDEKEDIYQHYLTQKTS